MTDVKETAYFQSVKRFKDIRELKKVSFLQLFCLAALVLARPQVLQSQLPGQPIEDPEVWTWGQHPNGVGYKAPNDLLYETCKATPNSPLCYEAATRRQCAQNPLISRTCMCARHLPVTDCTSIGAKPE